MFHFPPSLAYIRARASAAATLEYRSDYYQGLLKAPAAPRSSSFPKSKKGATLLDDPTCEAKSTQGRGRGGGSPLIVWSSVCPRSVCQCVGGTCVKRIFPPLEDITKYGYNCSKYDTAIIHCSIV